MFRKLWMIMLSVIVSTMMITAAFAQDVYVTKYGKKYHKEGSRFIQDKDVEKMTREEAEERGYKPSSEILKDDAAKKENKAE